MSRKTSICPEIAPYCNMGIDFSNQLAAAVREFNGKIEVPGRRPGLVGVSHASYLRARPHDVYNNPTVEDLLGGRPVKSLFPNQIRGAVKAIYQTLANPHSIISCVGPTMSGKTGTEIAFQVLAPVIAHVVAQRKVRCVVLTPYRMAIQEQAQDQLDAFLDIYGEVEICKPSERSGINIRRHHQNLVSHRDAAGVLPIDRRVKPVMANLVDYVNRSWAAGYEVWVIVDEHHYGTGVCSLLNTFCQNFASSLCGRDGRLRLIGFSASPWETDQDHRNAAWRVNLFHGPTYYGLPFINGRHIDEDGTPFRVPRFHSFDEMAAELSLPFLTSMVPGQYLRGSDEDYRERCVRTMADFVSRLVGRRFNHSEPVEGMAVRFVIENTVMSRFCEKMQAIFDSNGSRVEVVPYFEGSSVASNLPLEKVLSKRPDKSRPALVVMTAGGTMADFVPGFISRLADFTPEYGRLSTAVQNFPGRVTGHGKSGECILTAVNKAKMMRYIQTMGDPEGEKAHPRTVTVSKASVAAGQPRPVLSAGSDFAEFYLRPCMVQHIPQVAAAIAQISDRLLAAFHAQDQTVSIVDGQPHVEPGVDGGTFPDLAIFSQEVLDLIDSQIVAPDSAGRLQLFRPGQTDTSIGRHCYANRLGFRYRRYGGCIGFHVDAEGRSNLPEGCQAVKVWAIWELVAVPGGGWTPSLASIRFNIVPLAKANRQPASRKPGEEPTSGLTLPVPAGQGKKSSMFSLYAPDPAEEVA